MKINSLLAFALLMVSGFALRAQPAAPASRDAAPAASHEVSPAASHEVSAPASRDMSGPVSRDASAPVSRENTKALAGKPPVQNPNGAAPGFPRPSEMRLNSILENSKFMQSEEEKLFAISTVLTSTVRPRGFTNVPWPSKEELLDGIEMEEYKVKDLNVTPAELAGYKKKMPELCLAMGKNYEKFLVQKHGMPANFHFEFPCGNYALGLQPLNAFNLTVFSPDLLVVILDMYVYGVYAYAPSGAKGVSRGFSVLSAAGIPGGYQQLVLEILLLLSLGLGIGALVKILRG